MFSCEVYAILIKRVNDIPNSEAGETLLMYQDNHPQLPLGSDGIGELSWTDSVTQAHRLKVAKLVDL